MALIGGNQTITTHNSTVFNISEQMFLKYEKEFDLNPDLSNNDFGFTLQRQKLVTTNIPYKFTWELVALTNSFIRPLVAEVGEYINNLKVTGAVTAWTLADNRIKSRDTAATSPFSDLIFTSHFIYITEIDYSEIDDTWSVLNMSAVELKLS